MDLMHSPGKPRPKAGYKCKICGKPGGKPDSHWYQLCPNRGKQDDQRAFNPPRKGYICKFCHKPGGEPDSHWFQQCPRRAEYEGVQVPHPLKVRGLLPSFNMQVPQPHTLAAQAAAVAMNMGVMPHYDYQQPQFTSSSGMGMFVYPGMVNPNVNQMNNMSQQQMFYMQQQGQNQHGPAHSHMMDNQGGGSSSSGVGGLNVNLDNFPGQDNVGSFHGSFSNKFSNGAQQATAEGENDLTAFYQNQPGNPGHRAYPMNVNAFEVGDRDDPDQILSSITSRTKGLKLSDPTADAQGSEVDEASAGRLRNM